MILSAHRVTWIIGAVLLCLSSAFDLPPPIGLASLPSSLQQQPLWTQGSNMPEPKSEAAGVALGGKIYILGGSINGKTTDIVNVYDPRKESWSNSAPLPIPLDHSGVATYNGKIYVSGGFLEDKVPSDKLFIYDSHTGEWSEGESLLEPRGALTADFIDGILYVIGGVDSSHTPVPSNEAYNPVSNEWTKKSPMPTARHHHTSAVVDGKLFVIGGRLLGNGIQSHINEALSNFNYNEMYFPKNDSWSVLEPMPTKRSGLAAASLNDSIYVFGGQGLYSALDNNERFDTRNNTWKSESPIPTARLGLEAMSYDNRVYVVGGKTDIGPNASPLNEIFAPASK
jgi:N-acetylneuraminic acid mutarotase